MDATFKAEFNKLLVSTFNNINKVEEKSLLKLGADLSIAEFHILECVAGGIDGARTICEIAEAMGVTVPTVTVAVKKLENKGYLCRSQNLSDGRSRIISLTDEGKKMNRKHEFFHKQMIFTVCDEFNEEEQALLFRCIKKFNEFFGVKAR